ncbi:CBS domain-containing protein [Nocardiopsis sp. EMB25]|uniref:CBS domain-containing protein n=1 Tax=Nocardiopsis TaxID=2013 RepID=UPI0003497EA9|nr:MULTISPECIES: CBS domain-containing protein [Nocardiopsis]MCY9783429.1 CBS domain-containing protein [Nocardiopsis sp. EMB25]
MTTATTVGDLMTADVLRTRGDTGYKELAAFMRSHHVSALPVVDDRDRVRGVVSTADLLLKLADPDPDEGYTAEPWRERLERLKSGGSTARDFMTSPARTTTADASPHEAAELMRRHGVKRLPVVDDDGRLVGLVSRADLLGVYGTPDDELRQLVDREVVRDRLGLTEVDTSVRDGVVSLSGTVPRRTDIPRLAHAVRTVEGVVRVDCRLAYDVDDLTPLGTTVV